MQNLLKVALEDPDVKAKFSRAGLSTDFMPADQFQQEMEKIWNTVGLLLKENKLN